MPLLSGNNKLLKLNELDKPQLLSRQDKPRLPNKRSNNKHLSHNPQQGGAIEIVVKHALQVLHRYTEDKLVIALV